METVYTKANKRIELNNSHYAARGGEGVVYVKGKLAYKIGSPIPEGKIRELKVLAGPTIAAPMDSIFDKNGKMLGIVMPAVKKDYVWAELFTSNFKNGRSLDLSDLSEQLFNIAHAAHAEKCLIVDANELNFIVNKDGTVVAIDVNSWQTPSYKATALMQSVQDFRSPNKFSAGTDFYSLAVIDFQKWTNMHPYKGRHDDYEGSIIDCIKSRRKDLVSVFNSKVRTPNSFLEVDVIPAGLRAWFFDLFEKGKYGPPPSSFEKASIPLHKKIVGGTLKVEQYYKSAPKPEQYPTDIDFEFVIGNYAVKDNFIYQLSLFKNSTLTKKMHSIVNARHSNNVIYQDLFGQFSFFVNGEMVYCEEAKDQKIISAITDKDALAVCAHDGQSYNLYVYHRKKLVYSLSDISPIETNLLCLDKGLLILKNGTDLHCIAGSKSKELLNVNIPPDAVMASDSDVPLFLHNGKYYKFSEKGKN